jgi:hypothetical protein
LWRSLLGNLKHRCHGNVTAAVCKTKHTLTSLLIRILLERNLWQQVQNFFEWIPCKFGKSYTGEMGRLLGVWVQEYRHNVLEGLVPQHANEGQWIGWNEARRGIGKMRDKCMWCSRQIHSATLVWKFCTYKVYSSD